MVKSNHKARIQKARRRAEAEKQRILRKEIYFEFQNNIEVVQLKDVAIYYYRIESPTLWESILDVPTTVSCVTWDTDKLYDTVSKLGGNEYDLKRIYNDMIIQHPEAISCISMKDYATK